MTKYQDSQNQSPDSYIQDSGMVITKFRDSEPIKERENAKITMNIVNNGQNLVIAIIRFMALIWRNIANCHVTCAQGNLLKGIANKTLWS